MYGELRTLRALPCLHQLLGVFQCLGGDVLSRKHASDLAGSFLTLQLGNLGHDTAFLLSFRDRIVVVCESGNLR